ncbi:MAG: helix-turn-helix domain-containing protein [Gemmatimonadaceae bacterium]|jgi:DNA-binding transcriptional regulator YiaG|nr:helix-turn-helix domain-containing protein [Gemmatimonadaceae bacterium]
MTAPPLDRKDATDELYDIELLRALRNAPRSVVTELPTTPATDPWMALVRDVCEQNRRVGGMHAGLRMLHSGTFAFVVSFAPAITGGTGSTVERAGRERSDHVSSARAAVYIAPVRRRDNVAAEAPAAVEVVPAVTAGEQVEAAKAALGLTTTDVARILNVSRATVHAWVRGEVAVPQERAVRQRLYDLAQLAQEWTGRTGTSLGRLGHAPVLDEGVSLVALLVAPVWDPAAVHQALDVLATWMKSTNDAYVQRRPVGTGTANATPEDVAAAEGVQIRRKLHRLRALRHRG